MTTPHHPDGRAADFVLQGPPQRRSTSTSTATHAERGSSMEDDTVYNFSSGQGILLTANDHHFDPQDCDAPLPSIERDLETLGINDDGYVDVSARAASDTPAISISAELGRLALEDRAIATPDRTASLSPEAHRGTPVSARRRRRSSQSMIPTYEVDKERLPESKFYQPRFQAAFQQSKELANQLADTLSSCKLTAEPDSAIYRLHSQAKEASNYNGLKDWRIGLVGDSGAGKSSLINSLLDMKDFARASSGGEACTCTVTEYHFHSPSVPEYTVEVVYFTKNQLLNQFTELLRSYRRFSPHVGDSEEAGALLERGGEDLAKENRALQTTLSEASSVAWHTFEAAFKNQPLTRAYLRSEDEQTILDQMSSWIDDSMRERGLSPDSPPDTQKFSHANEVVCSRTLIDLTSESAAANTGASWPYIERVIVYLRAAILSKGLILVDLPGLHDTNSARKLITERYVTKCDEVFAIAEIGRAVTDAGLKAVIDLAERIQHKHVAIVCTKLDHVKAKEAVHHAAGQARIELIKRIEDHRRCQEELSEIEDELVHEPEGPTQISLYVAQSEQMTELRLLDYKLQQHMIDDRNHRVVGRLREQYGSSVQHVFCVSNEIYWEWRASRRDLVVPWLELSGIILLRRHCLELVADHQLRDAIMFMKDVVPSLVSSIDLWVKSSSGKIAAELRAKVREALEGVESSLQQTLANRLSPNSQVLTGLDIVFESQIRRHFTTANDIIWRRTAKEATEKWTTQVYHQYLTFPPSTNSNVGSFAVFCSHLGTYCTPKQGHRCWNAEILEGVIGHLTEPWVEFRDLVKAFFRHRRDTIGLSFEKALTPLGGLDLPASGREGFDSLQTLLETLRHTKNVLDDDTAKIVADFESALSRLGNTKFLSTIHDSFIGEHMKSAYLEAAMDFGSGSDARRKKIVSKRATDEELFNDMRTKLETQFLELARDAEVRLRETHARHLLAIRSAMDTLRNENAMLEAERFPEFRQRLGVHVADAQVQLRRIIDTIGNT